MKTILIQVGKTVNKHFIAGISDYVERINHYMPFDVVTIPELKNTKNLSEEQQKQAEGELILRQLQPTDTVVLLDEHGREYRSIEFASWLEQKRNTARRLVSTVALENDFFTSNDKAHLCGTGLSCLYHYQRRALSSRIVSLRIIWREKLRLENG